MRWRSELWVLVEVPRFGFVKRGPGGSIALLSPLPCPFNYGSVPGTTAADGAAEDVVLLGPRLRRGERVRAEVLGRVEFIDAGAADPKWVCGLPPLGATDRVRIAMFFRLYAGVKRLLNRARGLRGETRYAGLRVRPPGHGS